MLYTLILLIPVIIAVTGFLVLKSVQLGLRWQIQTQKHEPPSLEVQNPLTPVVHAIQEKRDEKEQTSIISEWLYGAEESR